MADKTSPPEKRLDVTITDRKAGGSLKHEPIRVQASAELAGDQLIVPITSVIPPSIIARLDMQEGVFKTQSPNWRAVMDCVALDTHHEGAVFNVMLGEEQVLRLNATAPAPMVAA